MGLKPNMENKILNTIYVTGHMLISFYSIAKLNYDTSNTVLKINHIEIDVYPLLFLKRQLYSRIKKQEVVQYSHGSCSSLSGV